MVDTKQKNRKEMRMRLKALVQAWDHTWEANAANPIPVRSTQAPSQPEGHSKTLRWLLGFSRSGGITKAKRKCAAFSVRDLRKGIGYSGITCSGRD